LPAGPVRVALREQLPLAQLPDADRVEVPRGPVEVAERVQALASTAAATESEPMMADMRKSFFMRVVSLTGEGCRCGSHAKETEAAMSAPFRAGETTFVVLSAACNTV
jgi:hypothetical protein